MTAQKNSAGYWLIQLKGDVLHLCRHRVQLKAASLVWADDT